MTHRSDGTIRVRSLEGSVLLDSALGGEAGENPIPLPTLGTASTDSRTASDVARTVYAQVAATAGEALENIPGGNEALSVPIETRLEPVPGIGTVQQQMDALDQLAASLVQSTASLNAATAQGAAVESLISVGSVPPAGNPYSAGSESDIDG